MCNDFGNRIPYDSYLQAFSQLRVRVETVDAWVPPAQAKGKAR